MQGNISDTESTDFAPDCNFRSLLHRARTRDADAATELVNLYEPELRRYIRLRLTNPRLRRYLDSVDVCQSVLGRFFVGLFAGRYQLRSASQLTALLTKMAKNEVCDCVRRQNSGRRGGQQGREVSLQSCPDLAATRFSLVEQSANREVIWMILHELPPYELSLARYRMDGFGWTELASKLGANAEVLRKRFHRAARRAVSRLRLHHPAGS